MQPHSTKKIITHDLPGTNSVDISYHITRVRVPLFEVDLGQGVYHGNYFHLFETGREDFLRKIGFSYREFMNRELHLAVVESSCVYRRPLHYDDVIDIYTAITWIRTRSLGVSQMIYREKENGGEQLCTKVDFNLVCVRFSGQPAVLPEDFRRIVEEWAEKRDPVD